MKTQEQIERELYKTIGAMDELENYIFNESPTPKGRDDAIDELEYLDFKRHTLEWVLS